jgi:hypothetical protein
LFGRANSTKVVQQDCNSIFFEEKKKFSFQ